MIGRRKRWAPGQNRFPSDATMPYTGELFRTPYGERLKIAIERLYEAFGGLHLDPELRYCKDCFTAADIEYLASRPVRELTFADAALIQGKVTTTLGSGKDFNYFLPRIFDSMAHDGIYLENALPRALSEGRKAGWTPSQLESVVEFMRAFFMAINALPWNLTWVANFDWILEELRGALPEAADGIRLVENDSEHALDRRP